MIKNFQKFNSEKGISLIITFFIMIIILAVVLSISILLYSEVKVLRDVGNSTVGLYAADSGIEKVLYYDRQVRPSNGQVCDSDYDAASSGTAVGTEPCLKDYPICYNKICTKSVARGLCSMLVSANDDKYYCKNETCPTSADPETCNFLYSIYCNNSDDIAPNNDFPKLPRGVKMVSGTIATNKGKDGCDPAVCDDCEISFNSVLDKGSNTNGEIDYSTTAKIYTDISGSSNFEIDSKGVYSGVGREIQTLTTTNSLGINNCNNHGTYNPIGGFCSCNPSYYDDSQNCKTVKNDGPCSSNSDCTDADCNGSTCGGLAPGGTCRSSDDCLSGNCVNTICS